MLGVMSLFEFMKDFFFLFGYVTSYNLFPEPLSPEEESYYLDLFEKGDENAKKVLIERNLRLVAHIAKKYTTSNVEQEDIISIGTIGLIKGINSYQQSKGVKLATYVARCVENAILTYWKVIKRFFYFLISQKRVPSGTLVGKIFVYYSSKTVLKELNK